MLKCKKKFGAASYQAPEISVSPVKSARVICASIESSSVREWNVESDSDALNF